MKCAGLLVLAWGLALGGCQAGQRPGLGAAASSSPDSVKIISMSPDTASTLHVGEMVPLEVAVEYTLASAQSGTVTLVVQQGEYGGEPLANEVQVIQKGSGKLQFKKDVTVPQTQAIQVFTPLGAQGATSTTVVDMRAYAVNRP
jgi:hypothetical protein